MKKRLAVFIASMLAILSATATANAYVFDNFETPGQTAGQAPNGWGYSSGVLVSNAGVKIDNASLYIPTTLGVTNSVGAVGTKIWTDFYTVPRPFVSGSQDAPTIDSNATAQFFVNTNGLWVTISGNGGNGFKTNTCTQPILTGIYPTVTTYSAFYHVSVLHDYSASNWSLFVDDVLLATNLQFISSGVSTHTWFQVQNLGGSSTNACWLDNFLVTNKISTNSKTNGIKNSVPGTTLPIADALAHFGAVQDPRPTNKTISVVGSNGVDLTFGRLLAGATYIVYGTPNFDLTGLQSNGVVQGISYTDTNSLVAGDRQFYKLVTMSSDGAVAMTNDEIYAAYKQTRGARMMYITGVPVMYTTTSNSTFNGELGNQLKAGLTDGDTITAMPVGGTNKYVFTLTGPVWIGANGPADKDVVFAPGSGMIINSMGAGGSAYLAGMKPLTHPIVTNAPGVWTYTVWASDTTNIANGAIYGLSANSGDYIFVQPASSSSITRARYFSGWKNNIWGTGAPLSMTLRPGDGVIYKNTGLTTNTWNQ